MSIMIVGEAWGEQEEREGAPFVGPSGKLLNMMLAQVGIKRADCYLTNVFNFRPRPTNDVKNLGGPKAEGIPGYPPIVTGKWVRKEFQPEIDRLHHEVKTIQPNLIIALGGTAAWALLKTSGIRKIRGTPAQSFLGPKVLPTYHPAAVLREWKLRPILFADLDKAARQAEFSEVRRPMRELWIEPDFSDLLRFEHLHIRPSPYLSIDIETVGEQITCIGFSPAKSVALIVPFHSKAQKDGNYWRSLSEEVAVWQWVKRICESDKRIVGQNFLYDMHFLWRGYGIGCKGMEDDTMLLHHALQPEMEKGLAFLGSIYTEEASWKLERKVSTVKRED